MDTGAVSEGLGPSGGTGGILAGTLAATGGGGGGDDPCLSPVFADLGAAWSALPVWARTMCLIWMGLVLLLLIQP